jgi:serine/threonine-protein kinase
MGPLGGTSDSAASLREESDEDENTPTGDRVSREMPRDAAALVDASDHDDEPTTVFSTLFPDLLPKKVVPSPSFPPPPQAEGKNLSPVGPGELMKAEPVLDLAALEQQGAIQATSDDDDEAEEAEPEDLENASPTQEAQILDFALQKLAGTESSSPRMNTSPPPHPPPPFKSAPPVPPAPPRPSTSAPSLPRASVAPPVPASRLSGAPPVPPRRSSAPSLPVSPAASADLGADSLLALAAAASRRSSAAPSAVSAPPPPRPIVSSPSLSMPPISLPPPRVLERSSDPNALTVMAASNSSDAPWTTLARPSRGRSLLKSALVIFALSAGVTVLVLRFFSGGDGSASVSAVDADNRPIETAQVLVDGKLACSRMPCELDDLAPGKHRVAVQAGELQAPDQIVTIKPGKGTKLQFMLGTAAAVGGTAGLHVRAQASGLRVYVNGEDKGDVPLTLGGLPAGEVTVKIAGNPLYAPFAQNVVLKSDSVLTFEPKLVPLKAMISIQRGDNAQGAFVEVIGPDRRQALFELPARVEVTPGANYRVRATRTGYRDFEVEVPFSDSEAEKEVRVDLDPTGTAARAPRAAAPAAVAPAAPRGGPPAALAAAMAPNAPATPATPTPGAATAAGNGTLNLNSIPISNALVDGRPVGPTPRQVPVAAGTHSVTFVHPTLGRKSMTVNVVPGKTALAAAKF